MGKKRIHELAKELALTSTELLQRMAELHILPDNKLGPSHSIDENVAEEIKEKILRFLATSTKTVVRRRKKTGFSDITETQQEESGQESESEKTAESVVTTETSTTQVESPTLAADGGVTQTSAEPQPETLDKTSTAGQKAKTSAEPQKPYKVPTGKFDTATIIGVQELPKPIDPRGNPKVPAIATEKKFIPDFMKLSPTQVKPTPELQAPVAVTPPVVVTVVEPPVTVSPANVAPVTITPAAITPVTITPVDEAPSAVTPVAGPPLAVSPVAGTPQAVTPVAVAPTAVSPETGTTLGLSPTAETTLTPSGKTKVEFHPTGTPGDRRPQTQDGKTRTDRQRTRTVQRDGQRDGPRDAPRDGQRDGHRDGQADRGKRDFDRGSTGLAGRSTTYQQDTNRQRGEAGGQDQQARSGQVRQQKGREPIRRRNDRPGFQTPGQDSSQGRPPYSGQGQAGSEPARVVGVAKPWTIKKRDVPGQDQNQQGPSGRFSPRPQGGLRPTTQPRVPGQGGRPAEGQTDAQATTRRRSDRKKKGGFAEKTADDSRNARRRDLLVERTDIYSEGTWERTRTKKPKSGKKILAKTEITVPKAIKRRIKVDEVITVSELAHRLSLKVGDIIKKLMGMGVMAGLNQSLDFDTATLVAAEFGYDVEKSAFDEGDYLPVPEVGDKFPSVSRPPVVTIMGHVDHGKTSLLDYIRKTKIQEGEAGGITQHIGAYHVQVGQRYITFLDTPGHEAFTAMRSRGAQVTDIVILIVAADDGVMPQTREAADHAKAAKVPIIVAVNKVDKPGADPERIRRQMMELNLTQESWGGDTVFVDISAKTGQGVDDLLEMILLQADLLELKSRNEGPARGRIIDARLDKGRGAMATVLVGEGNLKQGDTYVCGVFHGKIRAMFDDHGLKVDEAGPAIPVEIQGISGIPQAGDEFIVMEDEKQAKQVSQHRLLKQRESVLVKTSKLTLENLFDHIKAGAVKGLNLIIKADVQGSLEAILDAVGKFSTPEIKITVIHSAIGVVTETDIMLASASNALIICFGIKPPSIKVQEVAESEEVQVRYYDVIYKLLEDIKEAMAGLLDPIKNVKILGQVEVRAIFNITKVGQVAGCYVTDGKVTRGARAKLIRGKETIYDGRIATLKREKNDVREVLSGYECGLSLEGHSDVHEGDHLEIYQIEETAATVDQINEAVERAAAQAAIKNAEVQAEANK